MASVDRLPGATNVRCTSFVSRNATVTKCPQALHATSCQHISTLAEGCQRISFGRCHILECDHRTSFTFYSPLPEAGATHLTSLSMPLSLVSYLRRRRQERRLRCQRRPSRDPPLPQVKKAPSAVGKFTWHEKGYENAALAAPPPYQTACWCASGPSADCDYQASSAEPLDRALGTANQPDQPSPCSASPPPYGQGDGVSCSSLPGTYCQHREMRSDDELCRAGHRVETCYIVHIQKTTSCEKCGGRAVASSSSTHVLAGYRSPQTPETPRRPSERARARLPYYGRLAHV